jgi:AraC family transcriptional regulator
MEDHIARGLTFCAPAVSDAAPRYMESDVIAPLHTIGADHSSSLKVAFWRSQVEEIPQVGDRDFVSIALNTGGGRVWRNHEKTSTEVGTIAMQPFEGALWRFEHPVEYVHFYVPFKLLVDVTECLFERELRHCEVSMPSGTRDERLCGAARRIKSALLSVKPTPLLLDSWALILAERVVRSFSRYADSRVRVSFGKNSCARRCDCRRLYRI